MEVWTQQFSVAASAPTKTADIMGAHESYPSETFFIDEMWWMSPEDWKFLKGCEWTDAGCPYWLYSEDNTNPTHSGGEIRDFPAVGSKPHEEPPEEILPCFVQDQEKHSAISKSGNPASLESPEGSKSTKDSESTGKSKSRKKLESQKPDYDNKSLSIAKKNPCIDVIPPLGRKQFLTSGGGRLTRSKHPVDYSEKKNWPRSWEDRGGIPQYTKRHNKRSRVRQAS